MLTMIGPWRSRASHSVSPRPVRLSNNVIAFSV
jgi:hypothetical protein